MDSLGVRAAANWVDRCRATRRSAATRGPRLFALRTLGDRRPHAEGLFVRQKRCSVEAVPVAFAPRLPGWRRTAVRGRPVDRPASRYPPPTPGSATRRLRPLDRQHLRRPGDQARAAAAGQERPRPAHRDHDPVGEPDEIDDVDPQPERPGDEPALAPERAHPADVGDAPQPADDRHVAPVLVAERRRRLTVQPCQHHPAGVLAALDAALRHARDGLAVLPRLHGRVADDEDLGVARDGEVLADPDPAGPVGLRARGLGNGAPEGRREHARRPQDGAGADGLRAVLVLHADVGVADVDDARAASAR